MDRIPYLSSDSLLDYIDLPGAVTAWDIAWDGGDIWVACAAPGTPIVRYNSSSVLVDQIPSSLVPSATGLTMDDEGCLWASDNVSMKIYRIDPEGTGIAGASSSVAVPAGISFSANPFGAALSVTLSGFCGPVDIRILDQAGRTVHTATAEADFVWDACDRGGTPLPAGVFTVLATDGVSTAAGRAVLLR